RRRSACPGLLRRGHERGRHARHGRRQRAARLHTVQLGSGRGAVNRPAEWNRYAAAVTSIATAATVITTAVVQPRLRSHVGFVRAPMTERSLVSSTTSTTSGGASTPFTTADQKSIAIASKPRKSSTRPIPIATASTE